MTSSTVRGRFSGVLARTAAIPRRLTAPWPAPGTGPGPSQGKLTLPYWPPERDPDLEHQITLTITETQQVAVGCNCHARIEVRSCWASSVARERWVTWHKERGITV